MTHEERVYHHLYETMEGIAEQSERIASLEELVLDMSECLEHSQPYCKKCKFQELGCQWFKFFDRMLELGLEVDDA